MPLIVDGITLEYFPQNWGGTGIGKLTDEQIKEIRRYCLDRKPSANGKFEGSIKFWTKYFFNRETPYNCILRDLCKRETLSERQVRLDQRKLVQSEQSETGGSDGGNCWTLASKNQNTVTADSPDGFCPESDGFCTEKADQSDSEPQASKKPGSSLSAKITRTLEQRNTDSSRKALASIQGASFLKDAPEVHVPPAPQAGQPPKRIPNVQQGVLRRPRAPRYAHPRPRAVLSVTPRVDATQARSYASALCTLVATVRSGSFIHPAARDR